MVAESTHASSDSNLRRVPKGQLPSLTPLRGLAAFWVVIYHYSVQCFPNLDAVHYTHLISKGYLAVDMFFMLSGFVMTHVYYRAFSTSESVKLNYRNFMVARVARLYPLHVFILLLFVATAVTAQLMTGAVAGIPLRGPESVTALIANIFMLQGLDAGKLSWNYPAWSISVEFMAYLAFPLALSLVWRASKAAKFALALFLFAALAWLAFLKTGDFDQWDGPITLLRCLPEFLLGTLLYFVVAGIRESWFNRDLAAFGVVAATIFCLHLGAPDFLIVMLFAGLIPIAVINTGNFTRLANIAPLIWLGEVSYSLYLIHGFVRFVAVKLLGGFGIQNNAELSSASSIILMLLMICVCFFAATATYSTVEVTWRRYIRSLFEGRRDNRPARLASSPHI
jgi:peptidoglycan/LPS O-acetylase OafA/YrhL